MNKDMRIAMALVLIEKAMSINGIAPRRREETGNLPTLFAGFSGHVAYVTFNLSRDGWSSEEGRLESKHLPLDADEDDFLKGYSDISAWMEEVRKEAEEKIAKQHENIERRDNKNG